ncbi:MULTISPECIES: DUF6286 domain-containing protein [unclassified Arthrobacter]|uniref:DUF6286 domain-containing protein n=1 Tax=unclassified Arthrobacter TaxID=235627 RepID=UPI001E566D78|nr:MULTISPECIES: DUF6286 domain-containing protein [unclassified Arthrobacter]MCC9144428.1 DUF6286 domain-containing protein [Arthrobacter sp. zg-Y919]MDK1275654.1 DUF6286 domain-containing protein [Arthrobacter sp. zg.Y919]MDM7991286.1 DUF6286 domain-containing protein [Arthrobacter sp. zg-Y877]WIB02978.1 DUF6286 domain-containing protein [Arthrobacter sp. zg-Y919]
MTAKTPPPVSMRRRPSRSVPAAISAVLLLALGVGLVWGAIARLVQGSWPPFVTEPLRWLGETGWNSTRGWTGAVVLLLIGLVLLLCAMIPGEFSTLPLRAKPVNMPGLPGAGESGGVPSVRGGETVVMSRRAVARLAASTCNHIDGVASASATASARKVHLEVSTALHGTSDLEHWVVDGVRSRLAATGLDPVPVVTATIRMRD